MKQGIRISNNAFRGKRNTRKYTIPVVQRLRKVFWLLYNFSEEMWKNQAAVSESHELSQNSYFTWRISGIPHLHVSWQYVGVPNAKCPAVMWSHLK